jgi:16S rRNA processing protein RimM
MPDSRTHTHRPDPAADEATDRVELGRVRGAHALRGELRVQYFGDDPENLLSAPFVWLADDPRERGAPRYEVLRTGTGRAGEVRMALRGIDDRDAADALRGKLVLGAAENLAPLADDEFYWHQLIGCEVRSTAGERLGVVYEIWETGAHDVLVVRSDEGRQILLSTARELMPEVDLEARCVVVEVLPGMLGEEPATGEDGAER